MLLTFNHSSIITSKPSTGRSAQLTDNTTFHKMKFLAAFNGFHSEAFKKVSIISAFCETGISLFNPSKVINKMQEVIEARNKAERQATPPPTTVSAHPTSQKINQLVTLSNSIRGQLGSSLPSPLRRDIDKFLRGSLIQVQVGAEAEEALLQTKVAEAARAARAKKTRRTVVTGGVITVDEARRRIVQRTKEEEEARKAREQRQLDRERRVHSKQIDHVVAKARVHIRRLKLQEEYGMAV
jgi:hypothetical protein